MIKLDMPINIKKKNPQGLRNFSVGKSVSRNNISS